jgi:Protein of unknown function (DUF4239)
MDIPVAAAIIAASVAVACGLMYSIHRLATRDVFLADTTRGAGVYGVAGTGFAVLLAFVVLIAFQQYDDAKAGAQSEAGAVIELFRNAEFFPGAERREIQGELTCYGRAVVEQEWPAMSGGRSDPLPMVEEWSVRLQRSYVSLRVRTPREQAAFSNILDLRNDRVAARRERLAEAEPTVTAPVWFILILGAVVSIGFVLLFIDRRGEVFAAQAALIGTVTTIVVAGMVLVWFLDHPYENQDGSIKPTEMESTLALMEAEEPNLRIPCTANGTSRRPS